MLAPKWLNLFKPNFFCRNKLNGFKQNAAPKVPDESATFLINLPLGFHITLCGLEAFRDHGVNKKQLACFC